MTTGILPNAGTPLILSGALHLLLGNLVIGFFEGWCLHHWFRFPKKAIAVMILANYATAWAAVGIASLEQWLFAPHDSVAITLQNFMPWFISAVALAWVFTTLVEWPFAAFCLRPGEHLHRRSFVPNLVVQSTSYILMFAWYAWVGEISLVTKTRTAGPAELPLPATVAVYFIGPDGGIYKTTRGNREPQRILNPGAGDWDRLIAKAAESGPDKATIAAISGRNEGRTSEPIEIPALSIPTRRGRQYEGGSWMNFGEAELLAQDSQWKVETGFWPIEGLDVSHPPSGVSYHLALETPFAMWHLRNAVVLPDETLLFQIEDDQICLLHLPTRRIRILANGRGATAVITPRG